MTSTMWCNALMMALGVIGGILLIVALVLLFFAHDVEKSEGVGYETPDETYRDRKRGFGICLTLGIIMLAAIPFIYSISSNFGPSIPVGQPPNPSVTAGDATDDPKTENLGVTTDDTQTGDSNSDNADSDENSASDDQTEAESFNAYKGGAKSSEDPEVTKTYCVPAVNPTEDEIDEFLKDFDLENGSDDSLTRKTGERRKAAATMTGKYTDPVNFPMPEEFRTGFRKAQKGELTQEEYDKLEREFRHWFYQEMIWNAPYGEMVLQTLNDLTRVTKNNPWITQNEAAIDLFYSGKYRQPQLGDANYEELMKIELNATPTNPDIQGWNYLVVASETSPTKFKPSVPWTRLMARTCILIDKYFDIEDLVERQSAKNWRMPDYKQDSSVRTKESPVQVDEPAVLFAYHHTTGEKAEYGSAEFGVVEDDCRTELYAPSEPVPEESTPPSPTDPPPSNPPDHTPPPTSTPTPTPTPVVTPTPTPVVTPTPTPIVTPTPKPTKNPEKDPANQDKAPNGGGTNLPADGSGDLQPTKPPHKPSPIQPTPAPSGGNNNIAISGGDKKPTSGTTGGTANDPTVVNPSGNTNGGDPPATEYIPPASNGASGEDCDESFSSDF